MVLLYKLDVTVSFTSCIMSANGISNGCKKYAVRSIVILVGHRTVFIVTLRSLARQSIACYKALAWMPLIYWGSGQEQTCQCIERR